MAKKVRKDNKGRVLKKGESQRKDLTYMYRWMDKRGERQCIYDRTLEGLREQEEQIAIEISKGIIRNNATLNELIERYLNIKAGLATSTYENYLYYYQHSIKDDEIGLARAREIKKSDILAFYARKSQKDNFSNGTIHILHKIIHPALQLAVEDDMIAKNPSDGCMKDYPENYEVKYALTFEEENEFLERISLKPLIERYLPLLAILLYTGVRISEALGLTWDDVDFTRRTITINHQLQYRKSNGKMRLYCVDTRKNEQKNSKKKKGKTKTKSGERVLPMSQVVYDMFVMQRVIWSNIKKDMDFEVDGYKNFVFLSFNTGRNLYPVGIQKLIKKIVAMNDVRELELPDISPHILRHTACTRYAEAGIDIKTIQYLMGHGDIKATMKIYNHTDLGRAQRELKKYEKMQAAYCKPNADSYTKTYTKTA